MNLLAEIDFPTGTVHVAIKSVFLGGKQYAANIAPGVEIGEFMGLDGTYEVSVVNLPIIDPGREIRSKLVSSNREIITGADVRLYDEKGALIGNKTIEGWSPLVNGLVFRLTEKIKVNQPLNKTIGDGPWNLDYINPDVQREAIPMVFNTWADIKAHLIDNRVNVGGLWLLGNRPISSITNFLIGGLTTTLYTLQNDGTYWWAKMAHGVLMGAPAGFPQFANISVTTPVYTPLQIITSALSGQLTVAANSAFNTWLNSRGFNSTNVHYYLDTVLTPKQTLERFCQHFNCSWRFDDNQEVVFEFIDRTSIVVEHLFIDGKGGGDIPGGATHTQPYLPETVRNHIKYQYDRNVLAGGFNGYSEYLGADRPDGDFIYTIDFEYFTTDAAASEAADEIYELRREPTAPITFTTLWSIGKDIYPGARVQVKHRNLKTNNLLFGVITRRRANPGKGTITFDMMDLNFLKRTFFWATPEGLPMFFDTFVVVE